jgi:cellulose synthase/poly-beta-1,6-N-acetylglucosamine synthase-like glycosyltransferase
MRAGALTVVGAAVVALVAGRWIRPGITGPAAASSAPTVISVGAEDEFQDALDRANPGDTIVLASGGTYRGPFHLPAKSGNAWISIQSSALASLPPAGTRVDRSHAALMPKVIAASGSVLVADRAAHHYRFSGIAIAPADGVFLTNVIDIGSSSRSLSDVPHDFVFERCVVRGDPVRGSRRGIALNGARVTVKDSIFTDFKEVGADSQAIGGWNGPGPFEIVNNYLEGAGENILFGGADPAINGLVPSDIRIERNRLAKPVAWKAVDPSSGQPAWTIKNLLELKNARRVTIDGNVLEYHWPQAQNGFAILFTVRNQDGRAPWSAVEDVTFTNNIIRHVSAGINILGRDDIHSSGQAQRLQIRNNLFTDVGFDWTVGTLFQVLNGADDVVFQHNTAIHSGTAVFGGDTLPHRRFRFLDNIVEHNQYGIIGSGAGPGLPSIERYFPGAEIRGNVVIGGHPQFYPGDNFFPASVDEVRFLDPERQRFQLAQGSPYLRRASDGKNPGVDMMALMAAQAGPTEAVAQTSASPLWLWLFWGALALIGYTYGGYGFAVQLWARWHKRPVRREPIEPTVSVLVVAFNEAAQIEERLSNLQSLDYPSHRLEIVVASDGSTDATAELAAAIPGVRVFAFTERRGKSAVFNDVVPQLSGTIVVFADARQRFDDGAIRALVAPFADPAVGGVSGQLVLVKAGGAEAGGTGSAMYWDVEKRIRWAEGEIDSSIGATGAIYAIRRECFEPLRRDTLVEDVVVPMRIVRRGRRVVFAPAAMAFDRITATSSHEFVRKVRTIAGVFQWFAREPWVLNPFSNRVWIQTVSHKGLRLLLPGLHAIVFIAALQLAASPFFALVFAAQVAFYAAALVAGVWTRGQRAPRLLLIPYTMCFLMAATAVALAKFVTGAQAVTWQRLPAANAARTR